ncbi:hypothetical protein Ahy_B05g078557 [Arachis hypogaea]|uniref:Uncharacterized protein n=1 Tax=Arachis hypogaea TaxID=3818 RepID=A0A444Z7D8_ARAHY|nr:hypothetical protein Ahy_B05g078557 [Arachis hypogaea]
MIHGLCGRTFSKSFFMKDEYCTKCYPKIFSSTIVINDSGYSSYRRRDTRECDSINVYLLMSYQAHVNIEYCNKSNAIKYLLKCVNNSPDKVAVGVSKEASSRSICLHRWPSMIKLTFHFSRKQNIIFKDNDDLEKIVKEGEEKCMMFLAWMEANKEFEAGQTLTYAKFSNQFVYDREERGWHPRKRGYSTGKLNYVPLGTSDIYPNSF